MRRFKYRSGASSFRVNILQAAFATLAFLPQAFGYGFESSGNRCNLSGHRQATRLIAEQVGAHEQTASRSLEQYAQRIPRNLDLLVIGETHLESAPKVFLKDNLEGLVQSGFRVLALEMLNQSAQDKADQYCSGELSREEFIRVWDQNWKYAHQKDNYLAVVDRACQLGMKLVAADIRDTTKTIAFEEAMPIRNVAMAERVYEEIEQGQPVIVLTGALHAVTEPYSQTDALYLRNATVNSIYMEVLAKDPSLRAYSLGFSSQIWFIDHESVCSSQSVQSEFEEFVLEYPLATSLKMSDVFEYDELILTESSE